MLNQSNEMDNSASESDENVNMENDKSEDDDTGDLVDDEIEAGPSSKCSNDQNPTKKQRKRGVIYISSIPKHMNVTILREMLGQYAKIGRVFLQPGKLTDEDKARKKKRRRLARHFTEGWVEFESKRAAKQVASTLNNSPIVTRKSSKFYDILWSMKYLPRFKWVHLSERLTYEKAVYRQKLQTEISQARKEAAFFQDNLDKSDKFKKLKKKGNKLNKEIKEKV